MSESTQHILRFIGHAHIDPVWRWRKEEGLAEVLATFRSAVDRLNEYPQIHFVASSAQFYEWVLAYDPTLFNEIKSLVAQGRWLLVGGWWVESDVNCPGGESHVRQGLYGQKFFQKHFGRKASIGFAPDTFGHPNTLPQILAGQALTSYFFLRPDHKEKRDMPGLEFHWQGPDGSTILMFRILESYNAYEEEIEPRLLWYKDVPAGAYAIFYGVGNHGGGPTIAAIEKIKSLQTSNPAIQFASLHDHVEEIRSSSKSLPTFSGELQGHSRGCYSACIEIKQLNRLAENRLLTAEKMTVLSGLLLQQRPVASFSAQWQDVLFNQFHDIMAGTAIEEAYTASRHELSAAIHAAWHATAAAAQVCAQNVDTLDWPVDAVPLLVFNPNSFAVKEYVQLEVQRVHKDVTPRLLNAQGESIPCQEILTSGVHVPDRIRLIFQAELPAVGYSSYALQFGDAPLLEASGVLARGNILENEELRVTFDPSTGAICSLYDKTAQRELAVAAMAVPLVLEDGDDTWGHRTLSYETTAGAFLQSESQVLERGPMRARYRIRSVFNASCIEQTFSLYRNCRYIDVHMNVDWHEQDRVLKWAFPTCLADGVMTYSSPYGFIERPMSGEEDPGQEWIDLSGHDDKGEFGIAVFNDSTCGYSARDGEIRLTVLRSPVWSHHIPQIARPEDGYRYMEQGSRTFMFRVYPHNGNRLEAHVARHAAQFSAPPFTSLTHRHGGVLPRESALIRVEPDDVLVTVLKPAEEKEGLVLRAVESRGVGCRSRIELTALERTIEAAFPAMGIRTFYIPFDPQKPVTEVNLLEEPLS
jgi:alpha-mannosidase